MALVKEAKEESLDLVWWGGPEEIGGQSSS